MSGHRLIATTHPLSTSVTCRRVAHTVPQVDNVPSSKQAAGEQEKFQPETRRWVSDHAVRLYTFRKRKHDRYSAWLGSARPAPVLLPSCYVTLCLPRECPVEAEGHAGLSSDEAVHYAPDRIYTQFPLRLHAGLSSSPSTAPCGSQGLPSSSPPSFKLLRPLPFISSFPPAQELPSRTYSRARLTLHLLWTSIAPIRRTLSTSLWEEGSFPS